MSVEKHQLWFSILHRVEILSSVSSRIPANVCLTDYHVYHLVSAAPGCLSRRTDVIIQNYQGGHDQSLSSSGSCRPEL